MAKEKKPEGEIFVERVFDVFEMAGREAKRDKKGRPVRTGENAVLRIFRPVCSEEGKFGVERWVCRFRIDGPEIAITRRLLGIDSLQALMCALMVAENDLYDLGERIGYLREAGYSAMHLVAHTCDRDHRDILRDLQGVEQIRYNRLYTLKTDMLDSARRVARRK